MLFYNNRIVRATTVLGSNPANVSTLFQRCFRSIWRRDVAQRQFNVEATLCTSTLKFTKFDNVESTLSIWTSIWTAIDNIETTLLFSRSIFTALGNVETILWIWPFSKKINLNSKRIYIFNFQIKIIEIWYDRLKICFILFLLLIKICKQIFVNWLSVMWIGFYLH